MNHVLSPKGCLCQSGVNHTTKGCPASLAGTHLRTSPAVVYVTKYASGMQAQWKAGLTLPEKSDFSEANVAGKKEFSPQVASWVTWG